MSYCLISPCSQLLKYRNLSSSEISMSVIRPETNRIQFGLLETRKHLLLVSFFRFVTLLIEACPRFLLIGIAAFRYEWIYKCLIVEFSHLSGTASLLTFQKTVKLSRRSYLPGISGRAQPSTFLGGTLITVSALQVSSCKVERVKWQALERGNRKPKEERVGINIPHSGRIERWYCSRRIPWTLAVGQGRAEIWSQGEWYPHPSRLSVWGREWSSPTRASEIRTSLRN